LPGDLRTAARISAATADAGIAILPGEVVVCARGCRDAKTRQRRPRAA
jgi:hypothetical protein